MTKPSVGVPPKDIYESLTPPQYYTVKGVGVFHTCTLCIGEDKAGGSRVQRQPELYNKTLSQREREVGQRGGGAGTLEDD